MANNTLRCPSCQSNAIARLGTIPSSIHFAGQQLPNPIPGGEFHQCKTCNLCFRYPQLSKGEMDVLYQQTQPDNWENSSAFREDWRIASTWIYQYMKQGSLLDVGCFNGGFLSFMGENFERFGVEINQNAANLARSQKIAILGSDFTDIINLPYTFDVVVAMDVIEHIENPAKLLASMAAVLRKGGLLIVSTGNTDSFTWKMMGSRYWYCTVAEHISFINPKWCRYMASNLNLKLLQLRCFAHLGEATPCQTMIDLWKNMFYYFFPAVFTWLRIKGYGGVDTSIHKSLASMPPMWFSAKDHFIVLFQKC